nr:TfpX/TfpZ family type IV pilin accessory protein [Niveibacterium umoris]
MTHLLASVVIALICAALVFQVWYPFPYNRILGGKELFLLVVAVDVVCGPVLTAVLFDRTKKRHLLIMDIGLVVVIQLAALAYGVFTMYQARPVFLAFEGNRFRVVRHLDVDFEQLARAPKEFRTIRRDGPTLIAVRLAASTDRDFPQSIQMSLRGDHPAFRPERWERYDLQRSKVVAELKPIAKLREKYPLRQKMIDDMLRQSGANERELGYLPMDAGKYADWVVVVRRQDAQPAAYLPLDGW